MRKLDADELEWCVLIEDEDGIEPEWYETRDEAEGAATTAMESHAIRVYVLRAVAIDEAPIKRRGE